MDWDSDRRVRLEEFVRRVREDADAGRPRDDDVLSALERIAQLEADASVLEAAHFKELVELRSKQAELLEAQERIAQLEAEVSREQADRVSAMKALEDECLKNHEAGGYGAELRTKVRLLEAALEEEHENISAELEHPKEKRSWARLDRCHQRARAKVKP